MTEVVSLVDASRIYDGPQPFKAIDRVSLSVDRGTLTAITGPSGSGKSTLLNLIGGLDRPTHGTIAVAGQSISSLNDKLLAKFRAQTIGFVFQQFHLIPFLNAVQNVEEGMAYQDISSPSRHKRALAALERVDLEGRATASVKELSGGQQQRVAIARAIAGDPSVILADEPTGNLDSSTTNDIMSLFVDLRNEGATVLMITHDHSLTTFADETVALLDGRRVLN